MLQYSPTPIQSIVNPAFDSAGVEVFVKREDLNHPFVSGNKWWKLKLNLVSAIAEGHHTVVTFGGAYSNHIYATAAAAQAVGLKSIGVIRGEETDVLNSTLQFARNAGMRLHFISRSAYRAKDNMLSTLHALFGKCYVIPEGGSNELGVAGVASFAEQLTPGFDYVCCPIGTGATFAGLVRGLKGAGHLLGFPVLKGGDAWYNAVEDFKPGYSNWTLRPDYHFGGYAKTDHVLKDFISSFIATNQIPIEHVYSGKMFYGIFDLVRKGYFEKGSKILAVHTGGIR